jgi:hypothetical protein
MTNGDRRLEHLMGLREEALAEMADAEAEMARLRSRIERLESEQRLGAAATPEYEDLKGHRLPRAEARLIDGYHSLLKLEGKILEARARR